MQFVVQFSGGVGSWFAARRLADIHGAGSVTLLFADTLIEDEDLYRFIREAAWNIGAPLIRIADGRNPWEVFRDTKYIGNSWIDPCSKILKRELLRKWIDTNCDPTTHQIALGIDWTEVHRFERAAPRWKPFTLIAPLCEKPYVGKDDATKALAEYGIKPPRLYSLGFPHNNCGGFCVKAGQAQFALLLRTMPERYAWHEEQERLTAEHIGKPVTVLRRQRNNVKAPLSLKTFREEQESQMAFDSDEWGGCGCAID